jgi:hypothetical protein
MKQKFQKNKTQFNIRLNKSEYDIIRELKDNFAINISQSFKLFLKQHLEYLKRENKK